MVNSIVIRTTALILKGGAVQEYVYKIGTGRGLDESQITESTHENECRLITFRLAFGLCTQLSCF